MCDSQADEEGAKWACEYCTYQNYRSALRCTMCAGSKPLFSEDIYRLSPSQTPAASDILSYQPHPKPSLTISRSKTPSPQPPPPPSLANDASSTAATATLPAPHVDTVPATSASSASSSSATQPPPPTTNSPVRPSPSPTAVAVAAIADPNIASPIARGATAVIGSTPSPTASRAAAQSPTNTSTWSCPTCTYLNAAGTRPSPRRCAQCGSAPRTTHAHIDENASMSVVRTSEALHNDMNDQLKALSMRTSAVAGSDPDLTAAAAAASLHAATGRRRSNGGAGNIHASNTSSPLGSASNLSGSRGNLSGASARISPVDMRSGYGLSKWGCSLCTYENFPKSQKCSMCGHARELQLPGDSIGTGGATGAATLICAPPMAGGAVADETDASAANALNSNGPTVAVAAAASAGQLSSPERGDSGDDSTNCASNYIIANRPPLTLQSHHQQQQQQSQRNNHRAYEPCNHNRYQLVATGGHSGANNAGDNNATTTASAGHNCDNLQERRYRQIRRQADWQWLHACLGVVENNYAAVEAYLSCGGNPGRTLTASEVSLLNRNSAFDVGHTLIHLAIRFHRDEMLPMLLTQITGSGPGIKRVPSYVAPDLASDIRRHFANSLRCRKAAFPCQYVSEHATFALPAEIEELPNTIQEQLHEELLDRDAQAQLECSPPALNWSLEITVRLGSRLMVLWNRSAGDCLLDSAMQATWGVFDRDNVLRRALADSLHQCGHIFYARWKEYEMAQAALMHFSLEEAQWQEDWATLLSLARQPGASLEQLHIFTLAHILRRPIVVYGVKYVKSFRGEDIGFARFEGLYLPLLWDQSFCSKSPIALGYTRGHFSALVPVEPYTRIDAACVDAEDVLFLPLMDCEHKLLPIHFLNHAEMGREESIMRQWLDVCVTEGGLLVAQQKLQKRPLLVAQMLEEWLNHYRRIAQVVSGPFSRRRPLNHTGYSSDGDTDEE